MTPANSGRIAFIGNSLPRRCGIATFTMDLQRALAAARPSAQTSIVAMNDPGRQYDYPPTVALQLRQEKFSDYARAADFLNSGRFDVISLQHEFGIFGGEAGHHVLSLLAQLTSPVVTTLHTVLAAPNPAQRGVLEEIIGASSRLVVMAEKARNLLQNVYNTPAHKIDVIPHGIPDAPFIEPDAAKAEFGLGGRAVILTFGLLAPNKGVEVMIDAMPAILKSRADAVYVILGATHPNLIREQGESYRQSLQRRARALGVEGQVRFLDQFVDQATLVRYLTACDVYVTPYLNEEQMTSGTLAYAFGMGRAIVSTPYWHAQELLSDGRGVLVPFSDAAATGRAIAELLDDGPRRQAMEARAYASSRTMTWERTAQRYLAAFDRVRPIDPPLPAIRRASPPKIGRTPEMRTGHFVSMCDETGLFQHAAHNVPDRAHGYCVDDTARALLLACALGDPGETRLPEALIARLASFVHHAWNPETRRFRNFMGFDRRWLEDQGSEDSHGRALWALGECARSDASASRRRWAGALFAEALTAVESFQSPRAWAFTLLGLDAYCAATADDIAAARARTLLADRLKLLLTTTATKDWLWFEDVLAYDNARMPQALIVAGMATGRADYVDAGLRSLKWLMTMQIAPGGWFRPVGTASFGQKRADPEPFDQQPVEAAATISACLAAWRADGDPRWRADADRAFAWFLGANDLSLPLADPETGSCRDGLHPDRVNENRGAESVLSYLLGLSEIRRLARLDANHTEVAFTGCAA